MQTLGDPRFRRFLVAATIMLAMLLIPNEVLVLTFQLSAFLFLGVTAWDLWGDGLLPQVRSLLSTGELVNPSVRAELGGEHVSTATGSARADREEGEAA